MRKDEHAVEGEYHIRSLYFDDIYDSCYTDSLNGNPFRKKYRIRIYDDNLETIKLEVKEKSYNRAVKYSSKITQEELIDLLMGETISEKGNLDDARTMVNIAIKTSIK